MEWAFGLNFQAQTEGGASYRGSVVQTLEGVREIGPRAQAIP